MQSLLYSLAAFVPYFTSFLNAGYHLKLKQLFLTFFQNLHCQVTQILLSDNMSNPQASSSYNDQGNEHIPIPPPMSPNRFTIPMEPKIAPIHLHLTMILKKLFNHPAPIPSFNDGLVASNLLSPLQMIYKGVCGIQDQLHVTQTNVSWLREVFSFLFAIVLTFDI